MYQHQYKQGLLASNYAMNDRLLPLNLRKKYAAVNSVQSLLVKQNFFNKQLVITIFWLIFVAFFNMALMKNAFAGTQLKLVASIKPVQLLVNEITGVSELGLTPKAALLLQNNQDHHLQSLEPSQHTIVTKADYVFYISDEFEAYMQKAKRSERSSKSVFKYIELGKLNGIRLLSIRKSGEMSHTYHGSVKPTLKPNNPSARHKHGDSGPDWHIWLNPDNAIVMLRKIRDVLFELDPSQGELYQRNYNNAVFRITVQSERVAEKMMHVMKTPFMTVHDGYQYFEEQYGLKSMGAIMRHHDKSPSVKRVAEAREMIENHNVRRVLKESRFSTIALEPVIKGFDDTKVMDLDAVGKAADPQIKTYTDFIDQFASVFYSSLMNDSL